MKKNQQTNKATRQKNRGRNASKYASKLARGNQMYGPGCCAHTQRVRGGIQDYQGESS